ncbi:MAG: hypothetical protein ACLTJG_02210 [[Clostridium] innocuum]
MPSGHNELRTLIREGCEPVVSGVLDFGLYCLENSLTITRTTEVQKSYRFIQMKTMGFDRGMVKKKPHAIQS